MFKWTQFPFIRISFFLILGIILYEETHLGIAFIGISLAASLLSFIILARFTRLRLATGLSGFLVITVFGILVSYLHDPTHDSSHISRLDGSDRFIARILRSGEDRDKSIRYLAELVSSSAADSVIERTSGKIYLYIKKADSISASHNSKLVPGTVLFVDAEIKKVASPSNEYIFDYRKYLERKHIYGQCFAAPADIRVYSTSEGTSFGHWSSSLRKILLSSLSHGISAEREFQIASAIMLGVKDYLTEEVRDAYAAAGAMHILAVSGLHVGIFYLLISHLLAWMLPGKRFRIIRLIVTIMLIFCYAVVTGLSASVFRAAVMFSVIAARVLVNRKSSIYNSLGFAALILLLYNPNFLYDVGFRLSFAAVFGIVMLHPFFYRLWQPKMVIIDKLWSLSCVSIAAQIATFPLSTYYFHQFPTYFLFANFFAIPAAFIILTGGFLYWILFFTGFPWLGFFTECYNAIIWVTNEVIFFFDALPGSVLSGLYLEMSESLLLYFLMLLIGIGLAYRSSFTVGVGMSVVFVLLFSIQLRSFRQFQQHEYLLYDLKQGIIVDYVAGKKVETFNGLAPDQLKVIEYSVAPIRLALGVTPMTVDQQNTRGWVHHQLISMHQAGGVSIAILRESPELYDLRRRINVDYLVITHRSIDDLSALSGKFDFDRLVFAGDVPPYLVEKLDRQASELGISTYRLADQGMLRIKLT